MEVYELTIPDDYTLLDTGISQSLFNEFNLCPRRFLYAINRWTSKKKEEKTSWGSKSHDILEKMYRYGKKPSRKLVDRWIEEVMEDYTLDTKELDSLLLNRYRNMLGNSIKIKIEKTQSISNAASGKSKLVVSHYTPVVSQR